MKEILIVHKYSYEIIRFKEDYRIFKRFSNGYWEELFNGKEYSVKDSEELEIAYQDYKNKNK